jgi:hypothetical protein
MELRSLSIASKLDFFCLIPEHSLYDSVLENNKNLNSTFSTIKTIKEKEEKNKIYLSYSCC